MLYPAKLPDELGVLGEQPVFDIFLPYLLSVVNVGARRPAKTEG